MGSATKTKLQTASTMSLKAIMRGGKERKIPVTGLNIHNKALNALKGRDSFLQADTRPQGAALRW